VVAAFATGSTSPLIALVAPQPLTATATPIAAAAVAAMISLRATAHECRRIAEGGSTLTTARPAWESKQ
jgi:uncharacterized membrane protein